MTAVILAAMIALGLIGPPPATASCIAPQLSLESSPAPTAVERGEHVLVIGNGFQIGCSDAWVASTGCGAGPSHPLETETPRTGIVLRLKQDDRRWELGAADSGLGGAPTGHVEWTVAIPGDARSGEATLVAGESELEITLR